MSHLSPEDVNRIKEEQKIRTTETVKTGLRMYFGFVWKILKITCGCIGIVAAIGLVIGLIYAGSQSIASLNRNRIYAATNEAYSTQQASVVREPTKAPEPTSTTQAFLPEFTADNPTLTPDTIGKLPEPTSTVEEQSQTQYPQWTPVGLSTYRISAITIGTDNSIYAGTTGSSSGIFKSTDNGINWNAVNNGLGGLDIVKLVVVPNDPETVYAVTNRGIWITLDGGSSWSKANFEGNNFFVISEDGSKLLTVRDTIFISLDRGVTWDKIQVDDERFQLYIASGGVVNKVITSDFATLYMMVVNEVLYKSQNGGTSWGLVPRVQDNILNDLTLSLSEKNSLFGCTQNRGIYRSTDGSGSWQAINNSLPNQGNNIVCQSIVSSQSNPGATYALLKDNGLFTSSDNGTTWSLVSPPNKIATTMVETPGGNILIGTENGIWQITPP